MRDDATVPATILSRTLDWLAGYLDWFGPDKWDQHFPARDFAGQTILELLLLCDSLQRGPRAGETSALVKDALDLAEDLVRQPDFGRGLGQVDEQFRYQTWLLGLIHRLGRSIDGFRPQVQRLLDEHQGRPIQHDWNSRETLEAAYFLSLGGFGHSLPSTAELFTQCAIEAHQPEQVDEQLAYEITHILLYAADLGRKALPPDQKLGPLVLALLQRFLAAQHYDLVAELVLCGHILGAQDDLIDQAWRQLGRAQLADGAIPGPPFQSAILAERSGEKAAAYVFRTCYHPTVVTALAAAEREAGEGTQP